MRSQNCSTGRWLKASWYTQIWNLSVVLLNSPTAWQRILEQTSCNHSSLWPTGGCRFSNTSSIRDMWHVAPNQRTTHVRSALPWQKQSTAPYRAPPGNSAQGGHSFPVFKFPGFSRVFNEGEFFVGPIYAKGCELINELDYNSKTTAPPVQMKSVEALFL